MRMPRTIFTLVATVISWPLMVASEDSADYRAITALLQQDVDEGRIAGAVALVSVAGEEVYFQKTGYADLEEGRPMQRDALFRIASMTKAITSVALMQLVESGEVELDHPVSDYLPAFSEMVWQAEPGQTAQEVRTPTIKELLTHTSGIVYGWFGPELQQTLYAKMALNDVFTPTTETSEERMAKLASLPLAFPPGEQWSYGLGIDVLGLVIQKVSGLTLAEYFDERIFEPLGMEDTWFAVPKKQEDLLTALYTPVGEEKTLTEVGSEAVVAGPLEFTGDFCLAGKDSLLDGGSGLVSTIDDYLRFLQIFLADEPTILSPASVDAMMTSQIGEKSIPPMNHGDGFGYGFGVLTERGQSEDVASVGTVSWGGIFNTYYWVDPKEKMIGILMTQIFPFDHLDTRDEFKRMTYEAHRNLSKKEVSP